MNIERQFMYQALASPWGIALRIPPTAKRETIQQKFYLERRRNLPTFGRIAIRPGPEPDILWLIREPDGTADADAQEASENDDPIA